MSCTFGLSGTNLGYLRANAFKCSSPKISAKISLRMLYLLRKLMPLNLRSVLYRFLRPPVLESKQWTNTGSTTLIRILVFRSKQEAVKSLTILIGALDNSTRFFDLHRCWAKRSPLLISCVSSLVAETNERFTIIIWSCLF